MTEKNGKTIFFYFGLTLTGSAILAFFLIDDAQKFFVLSDSLGKIFRSGIVAMIGLVFTCFGLIKK